MRYLIFILSILLTYFVPAFADNGAPLVGKVSDPIVEAQEKLIYAKGSYATVKEQEKAIEDLKRAVRLSLKASKLRAKAEKLQAKADTLANKATQNAITRGLYITNPLNPIQMQPPPAVERAAEKPAPIPGQPINIILPRQETVTYDEGASSDFLPSPPVPRNGY